MTHQIGLRKLFVRRIPLILLTGLLLSACNLHTAQKAEEAIGYREARFEQMSQKEITGLRGFLQSAASPSPRPLKEDQAWAGMPISR